MFRLLRSRDRGQVLVIAAVLLPVLLAMAGMAVDVGRYSSDRRSLQNAADAIALAAAQRLCESSCTNYSGAYAAANDILDEYDINPAHVTITGDGGSTEPHVHVVIDRPHNFTFMKVVGIDSHDVGARATANKVSWGGGSGVVPWAVTDDIVSSVGSGDVVTMKYDANNVETGNFGPIRIDVQQGEGSSDYENSVSYGSDTHICADSTPGCDVANCSTSGSFPDPCAEDAPGCDGPECKAKTGNMVGATSDGVDFRIDNTSTTCDEFDEAFPTSTGTDPDKIFRLANECNPWIDGPGACPDDNVGTLCSRRVIIIPVIDTFGSGSADVTVIRFALMFLEGYGGAACTGNDCEITGRFVNADFTSNALAGIYDPDSSIHFARLTE